MNLYLMIFMICFLVVVVFLTVYLTRIPIKNLNAFGNFIKKIFGVLPISKFVEAISNNIQSSKEKIEGT